MKYKVCFLIFNFGKLPDYFELWLKSAEANANYTFLMFMDVKSQYDFPRNVQVMYYTFDEFVKKIQDNYEFKVLIPEAYKICDFRPAFGEIFKEEIEGYDFWGTLDLDIILGNIDDFISEEMLENYDKILTRDHFCLYRNTEHINAHYKGVHELGNEIYKKVFTTPYVIAFGERGPYGVYRIWKYNNWKMYDKTICADVLPKYYHFEYKLSDEEREKAVLFYQDLKGKVYGIAESGEIKEWMYIHLQKRKMEYIRRNDNVKCNVIIPNKVILCDEKELDFIEQMARKYMSRNLGILDRLQEKLWKEDKRNRQIHNKKLVEKYEKAGYRIGIPL